MNTKSKIVTSAADGCGQPSSIRSMGNLPSRDHKGAEYKEPFMFSNRLSVSRGSALAVAALAAVACIGLAGTVSATAITVLNSDFSNPTTTSSSLGGTHILPTADGGYAADWGIDGYAGVIYDTQGFQNNAIPNLVGTQVGAVNGNNANTTLSSEPYNSDFYQNVGALQANTAYSLTVYTGYYNTDEAGVFGVLQLVNGTSDTGSVLNSVTYTPSTVWPYPFEDVNLSYTTGSAVSGDLTLVLGVAAPNSNSPWMLFNDVRLTATPVPDPAVIGLFAAGGMGLLLVGRKRAVRRSA